MVGKSLLRLARTLALQFVVLCFCAGAVEGRTLYVDGGNRDPQAPYTNWAMAADSIQDAIDVSVDGDVVLAAFFAGGSVSCTARVEVVGGFTNSLCAETSAFYSLRVEEE
jgi:hypothetical protein